LGIPDGDIGRAEHQVGLRLHGVRRRSHQPNAWAELLAEGGRRQQRDGLHRVRSRCVAGGRRRDRHLLRHIVRQRRVRRGLHPQLDGRARGHEAGRPAQAGYVARDLRPSGQCVVVLHVPARISAVTGDAEVVGGVAAVRDPHLEHRGDIGVGSQAGVLSVAGGVVDIGTGVVDLAGRPDLPVRPVHRARRDGSGRVALRPVCLGRRGEQRGERLTACDCLVRRDLHVNVGHAACVQLNCRVPGPNHLRRDVLAARELVEVLDRPATGPGRTGYQQAVRGVPVVLELQVVRGDRPLVHHRLSALARTVGVVHPVAGVRGVASERDQSIGLRRGGLTRRGPDGVG